MLDFRDEGYLNGYMNDSVSRYEMCLGKVGYPDKIKDYLLGETSPQTNYQHKMIQVCVQINWHQEFNRIRESKKEKN